MNEKSDQGSSANAPPCRLSLEGEVGIATAGELKQSIAAALESWPEVVIDGSGATSIDLASLQLLCAAHRTAAQRERSLILTGFRDEVFAMAVAEAGFCRRRACLLSPDSRACFWVSPSAGGK